MAAATFDVVELIGNVFGVNADMAFVACWMDAAVVPIVEKPYWLYIVDDDGVDGARPYGVLMLYNFVSWSLVNGIFACCCADATTFILPA